MRVTRFVLLLAAIVAAALQPRAGSAAQNLTVQREVRADGVVSPRDPRVRVRLPQSAKYLGADRWVLFGIANCELYAFVQADSRKRVRRLYWVQFEGYIPSMPKLHHEYTSPRHANIGGFDFYVDTWTESGAARDRAPDLKPLEALIRARGYAVPAGIGSGSDEQHIDALIRSKGYTMPPDTMSVRLAHVLDGERKELMIIYTEDLAPSGLRAADLQPDGSARARWPAIEAGLIRRAEQQIGIAAI